MKLNKLYIAILLFAGILTSCKVGKSYVRPDLHLPDSLAQHQDTVSFGDQDLGGNLHGFHTPQSYRPCVGS